ncbi:MAG TPA: mechanosensitive ion channel domain-containing protein [Candidatus Bathyarchaeia archaeon]|nr:mechanosensitive ion channel domain-containing protein [Candidatus Bathyarchaeia archaeon]
MVDILGVDVIRWVQIISAVAATILVAYIVSWTLSELLKKRSFPVDTGKRIVRITRYGIYAIGSILIIVFLAFDIVVGLLVGLGFLGLAIGFGLANVISNFAAGISVMISKSVVVGDQVKVGFFEGTVTKITITKTVLETSEGEIVYVPNSYFLSNPVSRKKHVSATDHKHDIEKEGVV